MMSHLFLNVEETVSVILFGIGFTMLLLHQNLIKKIMGMNIMDTAVYLFWLQRGISGAGWCRLWWMGSGMCLPISIRFPAALCLPESWFP